MDTVSLVELSRKALWIVLTVSAPIVLVAMSVGLIVGLLQAATQMQEFTLSFVPKIFAVLLTLAMCAAWMGEKLVIFTHYALTGF